MRDGISWRGRCRQEECYYNPNQSWTWMQILVGCQAQISRRAVTILGLFLCSWSVAWTLTRFRTPPSISTESVPCRAFVLELFRWSHARNRSVTALTPVHRRRQRGLLETRAPTPQGIFDEEEQEEQLLDGQVVGDDLTREFDSFKKRTGCHESMANPLEASSSTRAALRGRKWPVVSGVRESDRYLQPLLAEVPIGYYGSARNYFLIPDTASGPTWVNCPGELVGDTGPFFPTANSFLNCEEDRSLCEDFQEGDPYACDDMNNFRCFFEYKYADGSEVRGSIIKADVRFDLSDAPGVLISMALGCAVAGKGSNLEVEDEGNLDEDDDPMDRPTSDGSSDGILGLSLHRSSWLRQLHLEGLVSEYVVTVCLEPARPAHGPRSPLFERAGFVSFGDLFATQSASTIWTPSVLHNPANREIDRESTAMLVAELVEINYRGKGIDLRSGTRERGNMVVRGVRMHFDTGAGLTYLYPRVFRKIVSVLKEDARRLKFQKIEDDHTRKSFQRSCWWDKRERKKPLVREFGDLIMRFSSLADDGSTSDFVIKPEYYLTSGGDDETIITCFNMREMGKKILPSGCVLGAEALSGHLLTFSEQSGRIGWSPVTTCDNLRPTSLSD